MNTELHPSEDGVPVWGAVRVLEAGGSDGNMTWCRELGPPSCILNFVANFVIHILPQSPNFILYTSNDN